VANARHVHLFFTIHRFDLTPKEDRFIVHTSRRRHYRPAELARGYQKA